MYEEDEDNYISKSQRKRDCDALTDLGQQLVDLSDQHLKKIPMEEELRKAINIAKNIKKHSAMKRQRQYIGKLIRNSDWEIIQQHVDDIKQARNEQNAEFKEMEDWRDRMIESGDSVVNEFVGLFHEADRQKLRQLVRNTQQDIRLNKPPVHARQLFKYIRSMYENTHGEL